MAAVQHPGTPNPVPATPPVASPPATPSVDGGDAIDEALAGFNPEAEPAGAMPESEKPEGEPEKKPEPETDGKPKKKTRAELESFLFSDEQMATKDGRTKALEYLDKRRSKVDAIEIRVKEQRAELEQQVELIRTEYARANAELETDRARARAVREIDRRLTTGTVEEMLDTLGKLRGKGGREVWEEMAQAVISGRVRAPAAASPEVAELRTQIAELTRTLQEREERQAEGVERAETERLGGEVARLEAAVVSAASDGQKYPELARYTKLGLGENIIAEVVRLKTEARGGGRQLDNAGALAHIEAELKRLSPAGAIPARSEAAGKSSSVPAGAIPSSPAAASADDVPITGIAPSQTRSTGAPREKTQAELDADLAKDTAYLSSVLGVDLG
jgi:hypothetical protein